jgi:hypothetical protein
MYIMKIINIKIALAITLLLAIVSIGIAGCTNKQERAEDLTVKLYWDTGTLSPEYYYYYRITIGPDLKGIFEYQPGYGEPPAPDVWKVDFEVSRDQMDYLCQLIIENDLLKNQWETTDEIAEGGSFSSITIIANGNEYKIPGNAELKKEDVTKIDSVSDYIRKIVPAYIWEKMESQQRQFEESFANVSFSVTFINIKEMDKSGIFVPRVS